MTEVKIIPGKRRLPTTSGPECDSEAGSMVCYRVIIGDYLLAARLPAVTGFELLICQCARILCPPVLIRSGLVLLRIDP